MAFPGMEVTKVLTFLKKIGTKVPESILKRVLL
jgi:hypothetical protein